MAFVAITGAEMRTSSGTMYFTKPTAVGHVVWANGQSFIKAEEDIQILDFFVADAVNAGDYLELWVRNRNTGARFYGGVIKVASTVNRYAKTKKIRKGDTFSLYWQSA